MPAERGQGADRRQEVVTLGALRDGVQEAMRGRALRRAAPALRPDSRATGWPGRGVLGSAPRDAVAAVWAGPGGTATPCHYDPVDNVVGRFCGSKRWRLWRPSSGEPTGTPDYDVVVAPGDALFVPRGWWHRVDSLPCAGRRVRVAVVRRRGLRKAAGVLEPVMWVFCHKIKFLTRAGREKGTGGVAAPRPPGAPRRRGTRSSCGAWTWRRRGGAGD